MARGFATSLLDSDPAFKAFAAAVESKGLPLIVLLRFCRACAQLGSALTASSALLHKQRRVRGNGGHAAQLRHRDRSNHAEARRHAVAPQLTRIRLAIHVWIGSRLFIFADPESRGRIDGTTRLVNLVYIALASIVSLLTSIYVVRREAAAPLTSSTE